MCFCAKWSICCSSRGWKPGEGFYLHVLQSTTGVGVRPSCSGDNTGSERVQWGQEEVSWRSRLSLLVISPCSGARMFQAFLCFCSCLCGFSPGALVSSHAQKKMSIKLMGDFWLLLSASDPACIGNGCWNSTFLVSWLRNKKRRKEDGWNQTNAGWGGNMNSHHFIRQSAAKYV